MVASVSTWLAGISAIATVVALILKMWYDNSPKRKAKKRKEANIEIHNKIADRDAGWIKRLLDRMWAEG